MRLIECILICNCFVQTRSHKRNDVNSMKIDQSLCSSVRCTGQHGKTLKSFCEIHRYKIAYIIGRAGITSPGTYRETCLAMGSHMGDRLWPNGTLAIAKPLVVSTDSPPPVVHCV